MLVISFTVESLSGKKKTHQDISIGVAPGTFFHMSISCVLQVFGADDVLCTRIYVRE